MQIDSTQGFDALGAPDGARNVPHPEPTPSANREKRSETPPAATGIPTSYMKQAAAAETVRPEAVAEAKRLLASGDLDTPEAARQAAEAILTLGI